jgi:plasmid replication initiation protein
MILSSLLHGIIVNTHSLTVVKSNKVIEASYKLSLYEQRILLACIAQIHSKEELLEDCQFEISAKEIAELSNIDNLNNVYKFLAEAADKLLTRIIILNDPDPDNPRLKQRKANWMSHIDYYPGDGKVILQFSKGIIPYLSELSKNFTRYKLTSVTQFKSAYSIRLYELLVQWLSVGKREIEVDWLRKQLQVETNYPRVMELKKWVVDVAVVEINEHSNIWVNYTQRKAGRTITHFLFTFGEKEPKKPAQAKANGTKPIIPLFTGHPEYKVDNETVLADHQRLKTKPEPKPKKTLDSDKKSKITGLKRAVKG